MRNLKKIKTGLLAVIVCTVFQPAVNAQNFNEMLKATASDGETDDWFGSSVSISGDYAIVGAEKEDALELENAGAAYLFERDMDGEWSQIQKLIPSNRIKDAWFGHAVAISDNYIIVGAPYKDGSGTEVEQAGAAYIFERNDNGIWMEKQRIVSTDLDFGDQFGYSVSIDENMAIVGAPKSAINGSNNPPAAYLFKREFNENWAQKKIFTSPSGSSANLFGQSVSISGNYVVVGAPLEDGVGAFPGDIRINSGAAYIYTINLGSWTQIQKIESSDKNSTDNFGESVTIKNDRVIVGAPGYDVRV